MIIFAGLNILIRIFFAYANERGTIGRALCYQPLYMFYFKLCISFMTCLSEFFLSPLSTEIPNSWEYVLHMQPTSLSRIRSPKNVETIHFVQSVWGFPEGVGRQLALANRKKDFQTRRPPKKIQGIRMNFVLNGLER